RETLLNRPALYPPHGVEPNFNNPSTFRPQMLGVGISMFVIPTLAVAVRVYTKLVVLKKLALEGYLIISSWVSFPLYILVNQKGAGEHEWNLRVRDMIPFLYYLQIANTMYGIAIVLLKAAIIVQCLRVLVPTGFHTSTYWVLHALLSTHIIFYVIVTFIEIFNCSPRRKTWDPTVQGGHCMDGTATNISTAVINTASDLILVVIPQIIIWRLNIAIQKKWALSGLFLVGLLACAASTVRMYYSIFLGHFIRVGRDYTWGATMMGLSTTVEICCGFLAVCMPTIPCFFKHEPVNSAMS
ncbi:hypothetical protein BCR34DRAFT_439694, partial [Clohesyomyces aquaticus]